MSSPPVHLRPVPSPHNAQRTHETLRHIPPTSRGANDVTARPAAREKDLILAPPLGPAGRPRDPALDVLICDTTLLLLGEVGLEGCVLTEVARRAGVGKATIYRRWPSKEDLVCHVLQGPFPQLLPRDNIGSVQAQARAFLHAVVDGLATPRAQAWRRVVPALGPEIRLSLGLPPSPVGDWSGAIDVLTGRAARGHDVVADRLPSLAMALGGAYATLLEQWLTQTTDPSRPAYHLADRLLAALVDPHFTHHSTPVATGARPRGQGHTGPAGPQTSADQPSPPAAGPIRT